MPVFYIRPHSAPVRCGMDDIKRCGRLHERGIPLVAQGTARRFYRISSYTFSMSLLSLAIMFILVDREKTGSKRDTLP